MLRASHGRHVIRYLSSLRRPGKPPKSPSAAEKEEEEDEKGEKSTKFPLYKSRGQHILANPRTLDAIIDRADVSEEDTVLEIGPGTGNLTVRLLRAARRVVAVEIDPRMVGALRHRVDRLGLTAKLQIVSGDALRTEFPDFDLCVANIPYGISSPLLDKLLFSGTGTLRQFRSATLLLQKEFARRLVAEPGEEDRSRLAMNVSLVADVRVVMEVGRGNFVPPPKVDSSLVKIWPKLVVPEVDVDEWRALTRSCFSQRRKTLGAIFKQKGVLHGLVDDIIPDKEEEKGVEVLRGKVMSVLREVGLTAARAETVGEEEMLRLLSLFQSKGIRFRRP